MYCSNLSLFENIEGSRYSELEYYLKTEKISIPAEEFYNKNRYTHYTVHFKDIIDCIEMNRKDVSFESCEMIGNTVRFKICDNKRARRRFLKFFMNFENKIKWILLN